MEHCPLKETPILKHLNSLALEDCIALVVADSSRTNTFSSSEVVERHDVSRDTLPSPPKRPSCVVIAAEKHHQLLPEAEERCLVVQIKRSINPS